MTANKVAMGVTGLGALFVGWLWLDRQSILGQMRRLGERLEAENEVTHKLAQAIEAGATRDEVIDLDRCLRAEYHARFDGHSNVQ